jgi:hypothetical protein
MENIIGKVTDVKVLRQGRGGLNGFVIEFSTDQAINDSGVVEIVYDGSSKPFNIIEVEIVGGNLLGRAVECGYYSKLGNNKELDIRTLIGIDVTLVTDEKRLAQIYKQSCYC